MWSIEQSSPSRRGAVGLILAGLLVLSTPGGNRSAETPDEAQARAKAAFAKKSEKYDGKGGMPSS